MAIPRMLESNPLIVGLDVDTRERALELVRDLADVVGAFKVGPRLVHRYGEALIREIAAESPVFVDCKFFDIPSTMVAAVRASFESGASLVTVHAQAGKEALKALAELERELNQTRPFKILCVTMLTSFSAETLPPVLKDQSIREHVVQLADLVKECGLTGIVCSGEELADLRDKGLYLVTPGIRFTLEEAGDQKRVMGPAEATAHGASALVVARPIIESPNPRKAALDYSVAMMKKK
ncbi:MAG: orotidine-5'-phosphate decarboxylase [Bdellovibrionaceae bacterium]|nr:orotidine-5'-phosphate decarboxylase [Pseudobdellovibrionaceae bacterium]